PTSTPSTSVIPLWRPGLYRPRGRPRSRARQRPEGFSGSGMGKDLPHHELVREPLLLLAALGPALALALLVAPDRAGEDLADQRPVVHARRRRDHHEVAPPRRQPRERVALDEVDPPLRIHAEVHPGHVPAAQRDEALPGRLLELAAGAVVDPGRR